MKNETTIDKQALNELELWLDNSENTYKHAYSPYKHMVKTCLKRGARWSSEKYAAGLLRVVNFAAQDYNRNFGNGRWYDVFNMATRKELCKIRAEYDADDLIRYAKREATAKELNRISAVVWADWDFPHENIKPQDATTEQVKEVEKKSKRIIAGLLNKANKYAKEGKNDVFWRCVWQDTQFTVECWLSMAKREVR